MSKGFLPLLITVFIAVGVYYLWAVFLQFNSTIGMIVGIAVALIVSILFAIQKEKNKKKREKSE